MEDESLTYESKQNEYILIFLWDGKIILVPLIWDFPILKATEKNLILNLIHKEISMPFILL